MIGVAGTNYGAGNPPGLEGNRTSGYHDLINISPDISARTVEGVTGLIIHELYHEITLVNARSDDMTRQISDSLGGLSSTQEDVLRHIAEEITLRSMVEEIGRVNPEVDAQNQLPEGAQLEDLLEAYNDYWGDHYGERLTADQMTQLREMVESGELGVSPLNYAWPC